MFVSLRPTHPFLLSLLHNDQRDRSKLSRSNILSYATLSSRATLSSHFLRNDRRSLGSHKAQTQSVAANSIKKFHTGARIRKRGPTPSYRINPERGRERERERKREPGTFLCRVRVSAVPIILLFCTVLRVDARPGSSCITLPVTQ